MTLDACCSSASLSLLLVAAKYLLLLSIEEIFLVSRNISKRLTKENLYDSVILLFTDTPRTFISCLSKEMLSSYFLISFSSKLISTSAEAIQSVIPLFLALSVQSEN